MIAFTIPAEPVAFARSGGNGNIRYTPARQRDFMSLVRLAAAQAMNGDAPMTGAVEVTIRATYLTPSSWSKAKRAAAHWRTARPDADNLGKIILDSCNTIIFADDAQVASLAIQKKYGPLAGVTVTVMSLEGEAR